MGVRLFKCPLKLSLVHGALHCVRTVNTKARVDGEKMGYSNRVVRWGLSRLLPGFSLSTLDITSCWHISEHSTPPVHVDIDVNGTAVSSSIPQGSRA